MCGGMNRVGTGRGQISINISEAENGWIVNAHSQLASVSVLAFEADYERTSPASRGYNLGGHIGTALEKLRERDAEARRTLEQEASQNGNRAYGSAGEPGPRVSGIGVGQVQTATDFLNPGAQPQPAPDYGTVTRSGEEVEVPVGLRDEGDNLVNGETRPLPEEPLGDWPL